MDWYEIVYTLLDDEMIKSCGYAEYGDGLYDSNRALEGLIGMSEIMCNSEKFNDEFILEVINSSIKARNRYCSFSKNNVELPYVEYIDYEFVWNGMERVCRQCNCKVTDDEELVSDDYAYYCINDDEDLYSHETKIVPKSKVVSIR